MKIYIDDQEYEFTDDELDSMYIGEGREGTTYLYENDLEQFAFKIHDKWPEKSVISEKTCKELSTIDTSRLILPKDVIYDEDGKYIGYTKKYIEEIKPNIRKLTVGDVLKEFYLLERDSQILAEHLVEIMDLYYENTILSNGIYLCDPGSYEFRKDIVRRNLVKGFNCAAINEYEINVVLKHILKLKKEEFDRFKTIFYCNCDYASEIFYYLGYNREENFKEYVKRKTLR